MEKPSSSWDATFTPDVWECIIEFIPDYPSETLRNLACTNRELCIILRRRIFHKAVFAIMRSIGLREDQSQYLVPHWSKVPNLLSVLNSTPAIADCVKHLVIKVHLISDQLSAPPNYISLYQGPSSITKLVPYLTNLKTISFAISSKRSLAERIAWSSLPEEVRSAVHPLLHRVPELRLESLSGAFPASFRKNGVSALESLTVRPLGTFQVGDRFPKPVSVQQISTPQTSRALRLKSLTVDMAYAVDFADWLTIDNPAFPITINYIESLVLSGCMYRDVAGPNHPCYRILQRCARSVKRLELLPTDFLPQHLSVNASTIDLEGQWKPPSVLVPDLNLSSFKLINLTSLRLGGISLITRSRIYGEQVSFTTSLPFFLRTLQSLPFHEDRLPTLQHLHIDLEIQEFRAEAMKHVDWSKLSECLLNRPQFTYLRRVVIDITYVYNQTPNSNTDRVEKARPPTEVTRVLEDNADLIKLRRARGLVLTSSEPTVYPGHFF